MTGQKEGIPLQELIRRARQGDGAAFAELLEGQKQTLYKAARSYLHSDADVADAIGEMVLACWEKLDTLRQPEYFCTWMVRILIRKCQDILRQRGSCVPLEAASEPAYTEPGHARAEFLALLDSLDEKYRTVLLRYYGEGFRVAEIARILDLREETVKTRLPAGL